MLNNHRIYVGGVLAALLLLTGSPAAAQDTRSLKIENGNVYVDGRRIPETELPPSLDVRDAQVQYVFTGDAEPIIRLGDGYYVLDEGRLREAAPHERDEVAVILRNKFDADILDPSMNVHLDGLPDMAAYASPQAVVMQRKAEELQQKAERLQELQLSTQVKLDSERLEALERAAEEITVQAAEAARMAEAMPRLQVQGYLTQVQQNDQALFNRLVDERKMERETILLANEIRSMEEGPERSRKVEELRSKLDEIFDLKQDNRREEMEQLENRLEELQEKLEERERMRDDVVERRLRQLLHTADELNW